MTTPKQHILTSYDRLTDDLLEEFNLAFPGGYASYATEVTKANGEKFYAVRMECEDAVYLIRVELHTDKWEDADEEDDDLDEDIEEDEKGEMDIRGDIEEDDVEEETVSAADDDEGAGDDYDV